MAIEHPSKKIKIALFLVFKKIGNMIDTIKLSTAFYFLLLLVFIIWIEQNSFYHFNFDKFVSHF